MTKRKSFPGKMLSEQQRRATRAVRKVLIGSGDRPETPAKKRVRKALTGSAQRLDPQAGKQVTRGCDRSTLPLVLAICLLLPVLVSAQVYLPLLSRDEAQATATSIPVDRFLVTAVADRDTITLSNGERVRYIGIQAPEVGECYYAEAKARNAELVRGQWVRLVKDVSETDRYGQLLRYVYVREGPDEVFVNAELVRGGYAFAYTYPPDVAYAELFVQLQQEAREVGRGLWSACVTATPTQTSTY